MARLWRAYRPGLIGEAGGIVDLPADEAHHVRRVLRLRAGEALAVFDGAGTEWRGTLAEVSATAVRLRLEHAVETPVEAPLELRLFQSLCRSERMEWVVQKATEIGVSALTALRAERSAHPPPRPGRSDRWHRIAVEACKQSGRRCLPRIESVSELPPVDDPGTLAVILVPDPEAPSLGRLLERPPVARAWIAVGPEGGFAPSEVERATGGGWVRGHLGPRTLRTETAGLTAATILVHRWGDLGS